MQIVRRVFGTRIKQKIIINKKVEGRSNQKGEKLYPHEKLVQPT